MVASNNALNSLSLILNSSSASFTVSILTLCSTIISSIDLLLTSSVVSLGSILLLMLELIEATSESRKLSASFDLAISFFTSISRFEI